MDITNFNLRLASMVYCSFHITSLLLSTNRVRTSSVYLLVDRATAVLVPISFQLNGSDKIVPYCPLVPQYGVETTNVSLLSLGTLCAPAYVSAYFRDTLRWQITWFATSYFDLTAKAESHLIYKRGFLTLGLIVWS